MRTEVTKITPALARQWLDNNTSNRTLRRSTVEAIKRAYMRGEFRTTHQGIAFDEDGSLADGQHRLTAIGLMPEDFSVEMMVTWDMPREAFDVIDQGLRRSVADVLSLPPGLVSVARTLAVIRDTAHVGAITPQSMRPFIAGIQTQFYKLTDYCPRSHKTWGSARVRAAAVLHMVAGNDEDYVELSYHALNHQEYADMRPIVQTLNRQVEAGRGTKDSRTQTAGMTLFCRAFKAFDSANQDMEALVVSDTSSILQRARDVIDTHVLHVSAPVLEATPKKRKHFQRV